MEGDRQIVPHTHQAQPDYVDALEPGYHFCPTDLELIVYYLKRRIELGEHPAKSRLYEVNVYDHHPQELTGRYRSCDGKWYFFTRRERKYPNGTRVNRRTQKFGQWKLTQKETTVYDSMTGLEVGKKGSLTFLDHENLKTSWLMQEYTYNGTHVNEVTDWVLCKIYKKESKRTIYNINNQMDEQVQNTRNKGKVIQQQKEFHDEAPPAQRRRVLGNLERNQPTDQQFQHHLETMVASQDPDQGQVQFFSGTSTCEYYYPDQSMVTSTSGSRFLSGASSSSLACPTQVTSREILEQQVHSTNEDYSQVNMQSYNNPSMNATGDDREPNDYDAILSLLDEECPTYVTPFDDDWVQHTYDAFRSLLNEECPTYDVTPFNELLRRPI